MLKNLRLSLDLSRQELADETGRSLNYILKAEQLTFPTAPVALTSYYAKRLNLNPDQLRDAYRSAQRYERTQFYHHIRPRPLPTPGFSFCRKWLAVGVGQTDLNGMPDMHSPSQYLVSKVLCVPASAIYYAEKTGHISEAIFTALSDILDHADSGELYADIGLSLSYSEIQELHTGLARIWKELSE